MKRRYTRLLLAAIGALALCALPALAQVRGVRLTQQVPLRNGGGPVCQIQWDDVAAGDLASGLVSSITWYYAARKDGADRRRITTLFREDFSRGFLRNWIADGPFGHDWVIRQDRKDRRLYLAGSAKACPAVSALPMNGNAVLSVLLRPQDAQASFGLGLRVQPDGTAYVLRTDAGGIRLLEGNQVVAGPEALALEPGKWYWYEVGLQTRRKEVLVRARVLDEERQKVLVDLPCLYRPADPVLMHDGRVALVGSADFSEVYVDPWQARWVDDRRNQMFWDCSGVADGAYYLVAEVVDGKNPTRVIPSEEPIRVQRPLRVMRE